MICIIDLGTSKVSSILIDDAAKMTVKAFSSVETQGIKKGSIINIGATSDSIADSIRDLEMQSGEKIKEVNVAFSGEQISSTNSNGPVVIGQKEVTASDIQDALRISSTMKVPSDKTLLSVMPIEYIVDGQPGISDPMGMNGVRLEARTHLVYCSQNTKNNISKCVEEINSLKINKYFFNQLGAAECTLTNDQKELGICLIDIGAGTTDLTVYRGGSICFSKVLPNAGDYITESIAVNLKIPSYQAEEIKKKYGCAVADLASDEQLKITDVSSGNETTVSRVVLAEIVQQALSNILRYCINAIEENGLKEHIPAGYVVTGGTANLEGIKKLGDQMTQSSFSIGLPIINRPQKSDQLIKPQFSAIVGLVHFYAQEQNKEFTFNQSKGIIGQIVEWIKSEL